MVLHAKQYQNGVYKEGENGKITIEMWCFCSAQLSKDPYIDFKKVFFEDNKSYCSDWFQLFTQAILLNFIPIGFVQFTNVSATFLFIFLADFESQKTKTDLNDSIFILIYFQQLATLGFVQILTEVSSISNLFNVEWYMNAGTALCVTMCLNAFSTKASEFGIMILLLIRRCFDRGGRISLVNDDETEKLKEIKGFDWDDAIPNTR